MAARLPNNYRLKTSESFGRVVGWRQWKWDGRKERGVGRLVA